MTNLIRKSLPLLAICAIGLPMTAFVVGCKKEEPPPPPPPPPPPRVTTVDPQNVAQYLTLDPKVSLQNAKPMDCSEDEVKAILEFMSGFASGDADALRSMMDSTGRKVLDNLVESGRWSDATSKIIEVSLIDRVLTPQGDDVLTFSIVLPRAGRVQQDWRITERGDMYQFAPFAVVPESKQAMAAVEKAIKDAAAGDSGTGGTPGSTPPGQKSPTQPSTPTPQPGKGPGGG